MREKRIGKESGNGAKNAGEKRAATTQKCKQQQQQILRQRGKMASILAFLTLRLAVCAGLRRNNRARMIFRLVRVRMIFSINERVAICSCSVHFRNQLPRLLVVQRHRYLKEDFVVLEAWLFSSSSEPDVDLMKSSEQQRKSQRTQPLTSICIVRM